MMLLTRTPSALAFVGCLAFAVASASLAEDDSALALPGGMDTEQNCQCSSLDTAASCAASLICNWEPAPEPLARCAPKTFTVNMCSGLSLLECRSEEHPACEWLANSTADLDVGCHAADHTECALLGERACGHSRATSNCEWTTTDSAKNHGSCTAKSEEEGAESCLRFCEENKAEEDIGNCILACTDGMAICAHTSELQRVSPRHIDACKHQQQSAVPLPLAGQSRTSPWLFG